MARLWMIMGVQRSGTNTLFKCLASTNHVRAYNESVDSPLFRDLNLRPEPEVRSLLQDSSGPLMCKPINETTVRSVGEVLEEFAPHDPRVVWLYRDPVNCYHSHNQRWERFRNRAGTFAAHWNDRNRSVLRALAGHGRRIIVVRYEDLTEDPNVLRGVCAFLGTRGCYLFRPDRAIGRQRVSRADQELLDRETNDVLERLDASRLFVARDAPGGLPAWAHRGAGRLRRQLFKVRRATGRRR